MKTGKIQGNSAARGNARREFLKRAALAGGAVAVLPTATAAAPEAAKPANAQGYRKTAHVSRYYQSARI